MAHEYVEAVKHGIPTDDTFQGNVKQETVSTKEAVSASGSESISESGTVTRRLTKGSEGAEEKKAKTKKAYVDLLKVEKPGEVPSAKIRRHDDRWPFRYSQWLVPFALAFSRENLVDLPLLAIEGGPLIYTVTWGILMPWIAFVPGWLLYAMGQWTGRLPMSAVRSTLPALEGVFWYWILITAIQESIFFSETMDSLVSLVSFNASTEPDWTSRFPISHTVLQGQTYSTSLTAKFCITGVSLVFTGLLALSPRHLGYATFASLGPAVVSGLTLVSMTWEHIGPPETAWREDVSKQNLYWNLLVGICPSFALSPVVLGSLNEYHARFSFMEVLRLVTPIPIVVCMVISYLKAGVIAYDVTTGKDNYTYAILKPRIGEDHYAKLLIFAQTEVGVVAVLIGVMTVLAQGYRYLIMLHILKNCMRNVVPDSLASQGDKNEVIKYLSIVAASFVAFVLCIASQGAANSSSRRYFEVGLTFGHYLSILLYLLVFFFLHKDWQLQRARLRDMKPTFDISNTTFFRMVNGTKWVYVLIYLVLVSGTGFALVCRENGPKDAHDFKTVMMPAAAVVVATVLFFVPFGRQRATQEWGANMVSTVRPRCP